MKYLISFIVSFIIVYLFYLSTVILQVKKYDKFKKSNQVMYFVNRYKIDANKINMKKFTKILGFTNAFIIALSFTISNIVDNLYLQLLVGLLVLIPTMLLAYHVIGIKLKKEGK